MVSTIVYPITVGVGSLLKFDTASSKLAQYHGETCVWRIYCGLGCKPYLWYRSLRNNLGMTCTGQDTLYLCRSRGRHFNPMKVLYSSRKVACLCRLGLILQVGSKLRLQRPLSLPRDEA